MDSRADSDATDALVPFPIPVSLAIPAVVDTPAGNYADDRRDWHTVERSPNRRGADTTSAHPANAIHRIRLPEPR